MHSARQITGQPAVEVNVLCWSALTDARGMSLQDKLRQKQFFAAAGVPVADFRGVESAGDLAAAAAEFGFPFMLKSRT